MTEIEEMEEDKGRGRTRKRREMEVKDKMEETKDKKGIKGTTLKTKITETDHEIEHNCPGDSCPGRQLPLGDNCPNKENTL